MLLRGKLNVEVRNLTSLSKADRRRMIEFVYRGEERRSVIWRLVAASSSDPRLSFRRASGLSVAVEGGPGFGCFAFTAVIALAAW
jgi:hypothetical protein